MPGVRFDQTRKQVVSALLATSVGCFFFLGCARSGRTNNDAGDSKVSSKTVQATVHHTNTLEKLTVRKLGSERLIAIQFIDADRGWIASTNGSLYRTDDKGATWTKKSIALPSGAVVTGLSFVSSTHGWVAVQKSGDDVLDPNSEQFWIMHSADGGNSWAVQYSGDAAQVERIRFVNNFEGWAVGVRFTRERALRALPFILHTNSKGQDWTNLSERMSSKGLLDGITDVYASKQSEATMLTTHGRLFKTISAGRDWQELSSLEHDSPETYFGRLGETPDGQLWLLGGSDSLEGLGGMLARRESDGTWLRISIDSYLRDGMFISNEEIVICGHTRPTGKPIGLGGHAAGVVLRSSDGGKTWTVVYESKDIRNINALAAVDGSPIWAVGDDGLILRLTATTKVD
jgi:photosystem II stability/assembly factor-like uncharacterized protein